MNHNDNSCEKKYSKSCLIKCLKSVSDLPIGSDINVNDFTFKENEMTECIICIRPILYILQCFGVLHFENDIIKLKSIISSLFIRSLIEYIDSNITMFTGWEDYKGRPTQITDMNMLLCQSILYCMERKRVTLLGTDAKEIKKNIISRVILKANINQNDCYLMQYDEIAKQYQLIGGYVDSTDKDAYAAIIREISEELPEAEMEINKNFKLRTLNSANLYEKIISNTYGVYSGYELNIFLAYDVEYDIINKINKKINRWITLNEIIKRKANDGKAIITISNEMIDAMRTSAKSIEKPKFIWSELLNDRRIQIFGLILAFIGTLLTGLSIFV